MPAGQLFVELLVGVSVRPAPRAASLSWSFHLGFGVRHVVWLPRTCLENLTQVQKLHM